MRRCPGATAFAQPKIEVMSCPDCKADVEIWTDEATGKCPKCARTVIRTASQSCVDWCRYAKECLGDEKFTKYGEMKIALRRSTLITAVQAHTGEADPRLARARKMLAYAELLLPACTPADPSVVMAAAALQPLVAGVADAEAGLAAAQAILRELKYPEGLIKEVSRLIRPPDAAAARTTLHGQILHDAELLSTTERKSSIQESDLLTEPGRAAARGRK